ncbi:MAG: ABC transporter ATP-binding protein/permease [Spirochaetaceae bacterium]|jgi:ATP-binding cassette subfamily B protein|nr:ABC transporter ATP-binding protein/permease [Spirochaetaceae bacterium]
MNKNNELRTLYPYIYTYRFRYIAGLFFLIVVDGAQMIIPQFTRKAIDLISSGDFQLPQVIILCTTMVGIMLVIAGGRFLWRYFLHGSSRRIEAGLRQQLFSHLLTLNWDFYEKNKIGDLLARSTNDIGAVRMAIGWGLVAGIDGIVMTTVILIIIFMQDTGTAFFAILPLPLITLLIILFGSAVGKRFKKAQETYSKLSDTVQETFAGIHVVKSFTQESFFIKKFAQDNEEYQDANMAVVRLHGAFFPLISFLAGITTLIVMLAGGRNVILGIISAGDLVALLSYIQMLIWPMLGAGFTVNMVQRGIVSLRRINEVLTTVPQGAAGTFMPCTHSEKGDSGEPLQESARLEGWQQALRISACATDRESLPPLIELRNFSFAYKENKHVLNNISLTIDEGAHLGIFGRTGAGKSTLIKTFPRILDPPRGTLFIEGRDVRDWDLQELRALFGISPQDSQLFSDTIENNIAYGLDNWEREDIEAIAARAALDNDVRNFKEGLDTLIGERGITLSGGQKQRITIARAMIVNPKILILDDSFSALDAETEKKILRFIYEERIGKTTIIISHRTFALRNADAIAVLDGGLLAEYGAHEELMRQDGYYAKTAKLQQLSS